MQRLPRRRLARLALAGAGAVLGRRPPPAAAAALVGPGADGDAVVRYALRRVDDPAAESINAHLEATTASDVVATIPFATPLAVVDETPGESLPFGDGRWSEVRLPYGTG